MKRDNDAIIRWLLLYVGIVVLILGTPALSETTLKRWTEIGTFVQLVLFPALAMIGLWLACQRTSTATQQAETANQTAETGVKQLQRASAGDRWDRFHRGLDYLNNKENQTIRMVGIRTIMSVATEAPSEFYNLSMSALCDFCRENSAEEYRKFWEAPHNVRNLKQTPEDVELAINAISELQKTIKGAISTDFKPIRPKLSKIVLNNVLLQYCDFEGVTFNSCIMYFTQFSFCDLEASKWNGVRVEELTMTVCNLTASRADPEGSIANVGCFVYRKDDSGFEPQQEDMRKSFENVCDAGEKYRDTFDRSILTSQPPERLPVFTKTQKSEDDL